MALIRFYQRFLSGHKRCPTCRFTPTCSAYALEAFAERGFFAGLILTLWRILRCNPFSPGGWDPVPQRGFRTMPLRMGKYAPPVGREDSEDQAVDEAGDMKHSECAEKEQDPKESSQQKQA